jgi:hypothetical protein
MRREKPHTSKGLMLEAGGWKRSFFNRSKGFDCLFPASSLQPPVSRNGFRNLLQQPPSQQGCWRHAALETRRFCGRPAKNALKPPVTDAGG